MSRVLVVYYSFEGNTKKLAEELAKGLHADIQEIKPENERESKGFSKFLWGGSQVLMGKTPKLLPIQKNFKEYDLIFMGTPIWAGSFAPPIKTLLEGNYIKGKKIAYFFTHAGGAAKAGEKAKKTISENNTFLSEKGFANVSNNFEKSKTELLHWAKEILNKNK